jgi:hypothetical protein
MFDLVKYLVCGLKKQYYGRLICIVVHSGTLGISNFLGVLYLCWLYSRLEMPMKIMAITVNGLLVGIYRCEH